MPATRTRSRRASAAPVKAPEAAPTSTGRGLLELVRSVIEGSQERAAREADRLDRFIEDRIEDVLNRVNIPSRSDIERLNQSVEVLTAKVDALMNRDRGAGH